MKKKALFLITISLLGALNLGTVRHTEDPIRDTQTNPILYEQKKEEDKDGKKGALLYHVKNNPHDAFFIEPPFEVTPKKPVKETASGTALPTSADTAGWWEEQPTGAATPSAEETVPTSPSESSSVGEPAKEIKDTEKAAQSPTETADTANAPAGKGDDYWW